MKENGRMIRLMEEESTLMLTAADMKENGLRINNTDLVLKDGPMVHRTKANTCRERSMEKESSLGLTTALTLVTSMIITFTEQESMSGLMAASSLENGATTRWKAMVHSHGLMDVNTLVNM